MIFGKHLTKRYNMTGTWYTVRNKTKWEGRCRCINDIKRELRHCHAPWDA